VILGWRDLSPAPGETSREARRRGALEDRLLRERFRLKLGRLTEDSLTLWAHVWTDSQRQQLARAELARRSELER